MKVCLLNDQAERREGLKTLLRQLDRQAKFFDARDWRQTARLVRRHAPDLLVVDWERGMLAQDVWALRRQHPQLSIAALVDSVDGSAVTAMMQAGVLGVVPRRLHPRLIVRAFEIVLLGGHYVPAGALDVAPLAALPFSASHGDRLGRDLPRRARIAPILLSPRQEQIMRFVQMGVTNKAIARNLDISEGTVKIHLATIFRQLGASNRAAAVAIYNGWQPEALEVLRSVAQSAPRPVHGQRGRVPLRQPSARDCRRRDAANDWPGEWSGGVARRAAQPDEPLQVAEPPAAYRVAPPSEPGNAKA
jgi:DNA-binding NarL/FixJ family response regulator